MIEQLHQRGMRMLLWQIPLLKQMEQEPHAQNSADGETVIGHGWSAHNPDGSAYPSPGGGFTGALVPDLTSPAALAWGFARRRYLVGGVGGDGFHAHGRQHPWGGVVIFP